MLARAVTHALVGLEARRVEVEAHVKDGAAYPAVLLEAAESDTRVDPLHARKMAARLQAASASDPSERPVLLRLETKAGHGQGKPRAKVVEELTDVWGFLFWQLGMKM